MYFKRGKYDEAIAQYDKAIEICPNKGRPLQLTV